MDYDAVVIGSGLGGLSCAAMLRRAGLRVGVFERHDQPGGFASSYRRGDYTFEVSLHVLDAVGPGQPNHAVLCDLGIGDLELIRPRWLRREVWTDRDLWVPHGLDPYVDALDDAFPGCAPGVRALFDVAKRAHDAAYAGETSLSLLRRTAAELIAEHAPGAADALSGLCGYLGGPPERIGALPYCWLLAGYHVYGGYYPRGGSAALAAALVEAIGGVHLNAPVDRILCRRGRAVGIEVGGTEVSARWVVSNAAPPVTFGQLVPEDQVDPRYLARLRRMEPSGSFHRLCLGLDVPPESLGPCAYETFVRDGRLVTITAPSMLEGGPGVLCVTAHAPAVPLVEGEKDAAAARLLGAAERVLPGLANHVVVSDLAHPGTYARYANVPGGSVLGYASTPEQSGPRRLRNRTPVAGLVQAGAWVFPGAGQTAAMLSGRAAALEILS